MVDALRAVVEENGSREHGHPDLVEPVDAPTDCPVCVHVLHEVSHRALQVQGHVFLHVVATRDYPVFAVVNFSGKLSQLHLIL